MTYGARPVCRRGGCGHPASEEPAASEADLGFCDDHRRQIRELRDRLTGGHKGRPGQKQTAREA